jgi:hypothetical protein
MQKERRGVAHRAFRKSSLLRCLWRTAASRLTPTTFTLCYNFLSCERCKTSQAILCLRRRARGGVSLLHAKCRGTIALEWLCSQLARWSRRSIRLWNAATTCEVPRVAERGPALCARTGSTGSRRRSRPTLLRKICHHSRTLKPHLQRVN